MTSIYIYINTYTYTYSHINKNVQYLIYLSIKYAIKMITIIYIHNAYIIHTQYMHNTYKIHT